MHLRGDGVQAVREVGEEAHDTCGGGGGLELHYIYHIVIHIIHTYIHTSSAKEGRRRQIFTNCFPI